MYVIKNGTRVYPADRCDWIDSDTVTKGATQYIVKAVRFYPGNAAAVSLTDPSRLGYVANTGRFVPITASD